MDATLRALNRFGLGARRGERQKISDGRQWLRAQLDGGAPSLAAPAGVSAATIGDALRARAHGRQADEQERRQARRRVVEIGTSEVHAALSTRVTSERPFVERLVAFWSNHLCVSTGAKVIVAPLAGSYERDVIRPHVLGRFEDMVLASAKHPAMLVYLDNFQSIGPSSRGAGAGQRNNGQRRGLNENYARELLELHTLGVNGGYTQQDVQELAKILTGWTIDGIGGPGARLQRANQPRRRGAQGQTGAPRPGRSDRVRLPELLHEPGSKTVLGQRYSEAGVEEGERVIRALCRHPSTARFVATKLVTHFVSDEPPAAAVDRVARVFRSTDGDLKAVARALVDEPEAWRDDARKFRTPQDWFVAVLRAFGAERRASERAGRAAAAASAGLVAGRAEGIRRRPAGMGRPRLAAQSRRAGAHHRASCRRCASSIRDRWLTWSTCRRQSAARAAGRHVDLRARADRAGHRRPRVPVEVVMKRRDFVRTMCYGGLATFGLPVVSFAQVKQHGRLRLRPAAWRLRRPRRRRAVRRSRLPLAPRIVCLQRVRARRRSTTRSAWRQVSRRCARCGTPISWRSCTRWRFRIARAATSTARPFSRPDSIVPRAQSDGWLNRLLQVMSGTRTGIAIAAGMPLSLTGSYQVESWSPTQLGAVDDAFLERLAVLYRSDAALQNRFEAALQQQELVGEEPMARGNARRGGITPLMQAAAKILRQERGPNIAAMEFSGWDTHANQGLAGGALDRLLGPARRRPGGVPHRHGPGVGEHHGRRDDRVRPHGAAERHERHRSRHRRRGLRARPAPGEVDDRRRLAGAVVATRCSRDATSSRRSTRERC